MQPFLKPGERLLVSPVAAAAVRRCQIIAFDNGTSNLTAHRVIRIESRAGEPVFITRGDNPRSYVRAVRADQIQGRVAGKIQNGRPVYFSRRQERWGYIYSRLYWQLRIKANWLLWAGFNLVYPFLQKKYVLLDHNEESFVIKGIVLSRAVGECRVAGGTVDYCFNDHLMSWWRRSLRSRLHRLAAGKGLICRNSIP